MSTTKSEKRVKLQCAPENAEQMLGWLRTRGGLAIWDSVNLSNPGASWTTPARDLSGNPISKPSWQVGETPTRVITDPGDVEVVTPREVKRFHIVIRVGSQGLILKVTDGSTRRIRSAVVEAGEGAWYEFDYATQEAVIFVPGEVVPLAQYVVAPQQQQQGGMQT